MSPFEIPDLLRRRGQSLSSEGQRWLTGLDDLLQSLTEDWRLTIARQLSGATEAVVFEVDRPGSDPLVLKVGLPETLDSNENSLKAPGRD